ncbi:MAG: FtsQ-type POTRA domain-containing protein [Clostridia bacterium]|nr:FtsQ-type POTRA domain-containing protein [Clostridia bacterium]
MAKKITEAELRRRERKKKIRKRRFFIFLIILVLVGAGVFYYFLQTKLFPVKKVAASGSKLYSAQEIVSASGITDKTPLMTVSEGKITAKLQKKLPYIESVKINRTLPDSVKITVTDAKEAFAFKDKGKYFVISEKLRVLKASKKLKKGLIEVKADIGKLKTGDNVSFKNKEQKELFNFLYSYTKEKGIRLNKIDISNMTRVTIFASNLYEINLGSNENIKQKIDQLAVMIKEIGERKGKINLNMWSESDSKGTFIPEK